MGEAWELLDEIELAKRLGMARGAVCSWANRDIIPCVYSHGRRLFNFEAVVRALLELAAFDPWIRVHKPVHLLSARGMAGVTHLYRREWEELARRGGVPLFLSPKGEPLFCAPVAAEIGAVLPFIQGGRPGPRGAKDRRERWGYDPESPGSVVGVSVRISKGGFEREHGQFSEGAG